MTQHEISEKTKDAKQRLRIHDAARKMIEAEILGLQHICEHPNAKRWTSSDDGGGTDHHVHCPDCGYSEQR